MAVAPITAAAAPALQPAGRAVVAAAAAPFVPARALPLRRVVCRVASSNPSSSLSSPAAVGIDGGVHISQAAVFAEAVAPSASVRLTDPQQGIQRVFRASEVSGATVDEDPYLAVATAARYAAAPPVASIAPESATAKSRAAVVFVCGAPSLASEVMDRVATRCLGEFFSASDEAAVRQMLRVSLSVSLLDINGEDVRDALAIQRIGQPRPEAEGASNDPAFFPRFSAPSIPLQPAKDSSPAQRPSGAAVTRVEVGDQVEAELVVHTGLQNRRLLYFPFGQPIEAPSDATRVESIGSTRSHAVVVLRAAFFSRPQRTDAATGNVKDDAEVQVGPSHKLFIVQLGLPSWVACGALQAMQAIDKATTAAMQIASAQAARTLQVLGEVLSAVATCDQKQADDAIAGLADAVGSSSVTSAVAEGLTADAAQVVHVEIPPRLAFTGDADAVAFLMLANDFAERLASVEASGSGIYAKPPALPSPHSSAPVPVLATDPVTGLYVPGHSAPAPGAGLRHMPHFRPHEAPQPNLHQFGAGYYPENPSTLPSPAAPAMQHDIGSAYFGTPYGPDEEYQELNYVGSDQGHSFSPSSALDAGHSVAGATSMQVATFRPDPRGGQSHSGASGSLFVAPPVRSTRAQLAREVPAVQPDQPRISSLAPAMDHSLGQYHYATDPFQHQGNGNLSALFVGSSYVPPMDPSAVKFVDPRLRREEQERTREALARGDRLRDFHNRRPGFMKLEQYLSLSGPDAATAALVTDQQRKAKLAVQAAAANVSRRSSSNGRSGPEMPGMRLPGTYTFDANGSIRSGSDRGSLPLRRQLDTGLPVDDILAMAAPVAQAARRSSLGASSHAPLQQSTGALGQYDSMASAFDPSQVHKASDIQMLDAEIRAEVAMANSAVPASTFPSSTATENARRSSIASSIAPEGSVEHAMDSPDLGHSELDSPTDRRTGESSDGGKDRAFISNSVPVSAPAPAPAGKVDVVPGMRHLLRVIGSLSAARNGAVAYADLQQLRGHFAQLDRGNRGLINDISFSAALANAIPQLGPQGARSLVDAMHLIDVALIDYNDFVSALANLADGDGMLVP
jgi:hypothetical protein